MIEHSEFLPTATPFDGAGVLRFLATRVVGGIEYADGDSFARTVRLAGGPAVLRLQFHPDGVQLAAWLSADADLPELRRLVTALCDLAADPAMIERRLLRVSQLEDLVRATPGIRIPGSVDPAETAIRGLLGQQISLIGATRAAELVREHGDPLPEALRESAKSFGLTALFPTSATIAAIDPVRFAMPSSRQQALHTLALALATGQVDLRSADLEQTRESLLSLKGIGPWTAGYVLLRGCGHRDIWLDSDLVLRREAALRGVTAATLEPALGVRSYASLLIWSAAAHRH
ncbi:hypothetical protein HJ590_12430 [Naumannella sp. ID2617S]|nr:hypothetical protein [Naumannella sp. ID2617S]